MIWIESEEGLPGMDIYYGCKIHGVDYIVTEVKYGKVLFRKGIIYRYRLQQVIE
jgi:hypothetical protein